MLPFQTMVLKEILSQNTSSDICSGLIHVIGPKAIQ